VKREREMTRSVGGLAWTERTDRDAAVGGSEIGTTGIGETAAGPSRSGATGDEAGAGAAGVSHSHRRQWQPGASAGCAGFAGWPVRPVVVCLSQQEVSAVPQVDPGEQHDRFLGSV
jgi:hypothetical protein